MVMFMANLECIRQFTLADIIKTSEKSLWEIITIIIPIL